jgi:hypothetical protein
MADFINSTGIIGSIIQQGTINVTGDLTITFVMIFILMVAVAMMFKMPIEWILIFLYPILVVMVIMTPGNIYLKIAFGLSLLFFAIMFVRNLFIN